MKKILIILFIVLLIITGCTQSSDNHVDTLEEIPESSTPVHTDAKDNGSEVNEGSIDEVTGGMNPNGEPENTSDGDESTGDELSFEENLTTVTNEEVLDAIEQFESNYIEEEMNFYQTMLGRWYLMDDASTMMDIDQHIQLVSAGGHYISKGEYSVSDIDIDSKSITLHIFIEPIDYFTDEILEAEEYHSKVQMLNEGTELLYINDYLGQPNESHWVREASDTGITHE